MSMIVMVTIVLAHFAHVITPLLLLFRGEFFERFASLLPHGLSLFSAQPFHMVSPRLTHLLFLLRSELLPVVAHLLMEGVTLIRAQRVHLGAKLFSISLSLFRRGLGHRLT